MDARFASPTCALTPHDVPEGHIAPLFWQHGERPEILREELRAMRSAGIRQCIVESRPHPDWQGPGWWESLDAIFDEARRLGMLVWLFDDATYPSGRAGTLMRDRHPDLLKVYLAAREIDASGPMPGAFFRIEPWLAPGDALVGVVAARRTQMRGTGIAAETLVDLTDCVHDGGLRWDIPEGFWKVFVLVRTREGGEEWTKDYLNPLVPAAVHAYVAEVHEPHFNRYGQTYKGTFAGFFTDEPRFGNKPVYDAILGTVPMVIPWSDDLLEELSARWGAPFRALLPALWNDAAGLSSRARFLYMDVVSARFGRNFSGIIGAWCGDHGVRFIGHVVEDNGAHARLGHGAGHFYRALQGQDMAGLDIVYSALPGFPEGMISTPFGPWDMDFFRWGIATMASSAAHADPRKAGLTMCEIFGAYGWQLGLRDMKWLTDFACVRGVNFLVPHAFSPQYPDPDCPPHFYARGHNPQWNLFGQWSSYAERLCHLFSGGEHVAPVAVLYHAEAEWAGASEPFQTAVRALAEDQIGCDVLPMDTLLDHALTRVDSGSFTVNREAFRAFVVPYAEMLPARLLGFLSRLMDAGIPVLFLRDAPVAASEGEFPPTALAALRAHPAASIVPLSALAGTLRGRGIGDIAAEPRHAHLRTYRYQRAGMDLVACVNEDPRLCVDTWLGVTDVRAPFGYDALDDSLAKLQCECAPGRARVRLRLEPYQSLILVFPDSPASFPVRASHTPFVADLTRVAAVNGPWTFTATENEEEEPGEERFLALGDLSCLPGMGGFSGHVCYETDIDLGPAPGLWLDLGEVGESSEVWLDGASRGARICPPHRYSLAGAKPGSHHLRIVVTTTLERRHGANVFDRAMPQGPTGLVGPVTLQRSVGGPQAAG